MTDPTTTFITAFLIVCLAASPLYFLPTIIALACKRRQSLAIFLLNLFLGWSILGWVGALVWAALREGGEQVKAEYHGVYKGYPYRYLDEGRIEYLTRDGKRAAPSWTAFVATIDPANVGRTVT